jgi:hypothetical protein
VRFARLEILPSGQDVILAASFCVDQRWDPTGLLSSCGSGYLRGLPKFDAASGTIRVVNVHYDVLTQGLMLSAVHALAGAALGHDLETRLTFSVASDLAKLRNQIGEAIARPQGRDVTISGRVEAFGAPSLTWTKDGFLATFTATGSVDAGVHI